MGELNNIIQPIPQPPAAPPIRDNSPCQDLLNNDRRREFIRICVPLCEASMQTDWTTAEGILSGNEIENLVKYSINENCETALHVAASVDESNSKSITFVQNLVNMMAPEDLLLQNRNGNTALSLAAAAGNLKIAKIMVTKNREVLEVPNGEYMKPLYVAVLFGKLQLVEYLYEESQQMRAPGWTDANRSWVFLKCIELDFLDFALKVLELHPEVALNVSALGTLARKPSAFIKVKPSVIRRVINSIFCLKVEPVDSIAVRLLREIWTRVVERPRAEIENILRGPMVVIDGNHTYPSRALFVAAEMGNTTFLVELIRRYPDLMWKKNDNDQTIFHVAVSNCDASIYNLLYEIGSMKALIIAVKDEERNNMLHLVGKDVDKSRIEDVSGVAFQLQRKLLWFKEVESVIPPLYKEQKNYNGLTPYELFTKNHKSLVTKGEKWMKGTANQCVVVAALIATIVFAAAYTIPGGYHQDKGFPVFLDNGPFLGFVVLDAISFTLASTSILVFLSILTSRYTQEDFMASLPTKLLVGLSMLSLSIVTMMMSFSVSFFVLYRGGHIAVAIFISVVALVPICIHAYLQLPLLMDGFRSTNTRYLFGSKKQIIYYQNPTF